MRRQEGVGAALRVLSVDVWEVFGSERGSEVQRARLSQQIFPAVSRHRRVEQMWRPVSSHAREVILPKSDCQALAPNLRPLRPNSNLVQPRSKPKLVPRGLGMTLKSCLIGNS